MKTTLPFSTNIRKGIIHLVVGIIAMAILLNIYSNETAKGIFYDPNIATWSLLAAATNILGFYIHTFLLLPLLTFKKKRKQYIIYTLIGLIIFAYIINWFKALRSSEIVRDLNGTRLPASYFFFKTEWLFGVLVVALIVFVPIFLLSFIYHLFLISKQDRKKLLSVKYIERVANIVIGISLLFFATAISATNNIQALQTFMMFVAFTIVFYMNTLVYTANVLKNKGVVKYILLNTLSFGFILLSAKLVFSLAAKKVVLDLIDFIPVSILFFLVFISSFIYAYVRSKLKANERLFDLKLTAKESELQLLKSQVNPHFLFNTLNTLYATSLKENAPKTAQSITKLGSLIRYMQNDINKEFIPLQKEVDYLKDYMEIQKLRLAIEPEIITAFENIDTQMMSPGLFIPLVENAFKYGIHLTEKSTIRIQVQCSDQHIYFECKNNYDPNQKVHAMNEGFGIGIQNVEKRLELVYPEKHTFDIDKTETQFVVKLTLDLT